MFNFYYIYIFGTRHISIRHYHWATQFVLCNPKMLPPWYTDPVWCWHNQIQLRPRRLFYNFSGILEKIKKIINYFMLSSFQVFLSISPSLTIHNQYQWATRITLTGILNQILIFGTQLGIYNAILNLSCQTIVDKTGITFVNGCHKERGFE